MGNSKRLIERTEEYRANAYEILLEIGVIKTCELHDDFYYLTYKMDDNQIYARATAAFKRKHSEDIDFHLFQNQIKDILEYASTSADSCPYCAKMAKE